MAELEDVAFIKDGAPVGPRVDDVILDASVKSFCDELRFPVLRRIAAAMFFIFPPLGVAEVAPVRDLRRLSRISLS